MLKASKKSTFRRVGALCLIAFGMAVMSCHQASVNPQPPVNKDKPSPTYTPADSIRLNDDQPPKDVGGGGKGS